MLISSSNTMGENHFSHKLQYVAMVKKPSAAVINLTRQNTLQRFFTSRVSSRLMLQKKKKNGPLLL